MAKYILKAQQRRFDQGLLKPQGISHFHSNGGNPEIRRSASQASIGSLVVKQNLRVLKIGHFGGHGRCEIRPDIERVDSPKTGRVEINQIVKMLDHLLHKLIGIHITGSAQRATGKIAIQIS